MEDKKLTNQESLDLISGMIANTRKNFCNKGGSMFMIWGYTTALIAVIVYICWRYSGNDAYNWLWWGIPVIGGIGTFLFYRKNKKGVYTHMDNVVNYVWRVFSIACMGVVIFHSAVWLITGHPYFNILFVIGLLLSSSTALTGFIINSGIIVAGGMAGLLISLFIPMFSPFFQIMAFTAIALIAQAIPGTILNIKCRKSDKKPINV